MGLSNNQISYNDYILKKLHLILLIKKE